MAEKTRQSESRLRDLVGLVTHPREDLGHELKAWLNLSSNEGKASLAQAMLALANHGGGYVVLGIHNETKQEAPGRPDTLGTYDQDTVNGIIERFAEPSFHCDVHLVPHPETGREYPVVVVPGGHRRPIRAKRGGPDNKHVVKDCYYIRRPGPKSEPPQSAQEWDELIGRCLRAGKEELLERIQGILTGAAPEEPTVNQHLKRLEDWVGQCVARWNSLVAEKLSGECPNRYAKGYWHFAYIIVGQFKAPTVPQLLDAVCRIQGRETGWPPWIASMDGNNLKPYPHDGLIECWLRETLSADAAHSDFWMASPRGMLFLLRGYQEDCAEDVPAGTIMDLAMPVWRVGECLLHAERMSRALGALDADVLFQVDWHGLSGRKMISWSGERFMCGKQECHQDSVSSGPIKVPVGGISDTLPAIVQKATSPLYAAFDFFEPPESMFVEELAKMRRGP